MSDSGASGLSPAGDALVSLQGFWKLPTLKKLSNQNVGLRGTGMRLRSIELEMPDRSAAVRFLEGTWGLLDAGSRNGTSYLRGTEAIPYVVSVAEARARAVAAVTFSGTAAELEQVRSRAAAAGVRHSAALEFDEPGGGAGFFLEGPEGQVFRLVAEKERVEPLSPDRDRPLQVTHVVINARDREACTRFMLDVLGFRLSDRTRFMNFIRCDSVHHAIAYAQSEISSLNHIAFEMADLDAVMRGIGRLKDAGVEPAWGPGRHGPGNNVFAYFVVPFGAALEYTSEVQKIDDGYKVGGPEDWKWPPNRNDHWGVSTRNSAAMFEAEKNFRFRQPRL
jgi:2,3-dihydroxy-p-cumate/2,3-dihydroxybenzoate 3,4-dioxygenase